MFANARSVDGAAPVGVVVCQTPCYRSLEIIFHRKISIILHNLEHFHLPYPNIPILMLHLAYFVMKIVRNCCSEPLSFKLLSTTRVVRQSIISDDDTRFFHVFNLVNVVGQSILNPPSPPPVALSLLHVFH